MKVNYTVQFKRDLRRMEKRGCDRGKLQIVVDLLSAMHPLPCKYRNHKYIQYQGIMGCHIAPDWVLIYKIENGELNLLRTSTHSDLFCRTGSQSRRIL